jgi:hypothetical protein
MALDARPAKEVLELHQLALPNFHELSRPIHLV